MPKRHVHVFQAAIRFVNAELRLILRNIPIRIPREILRKDNIRRPRAPHRERVSNDPPLGLAVQAQTLAQVVNESDENHPARVSVGANCLRGLQQMLDLRQVRIRIAVVHQRIQKLRRFPNRLLSLVEAEVLFLLRQHINDSLILMVQTVELGDSGVSLGVVLPEFFFRLAFLVPAFEKFIPLLEVAKRCLALGFVLRGSGAHPGSP